MQSASSHSPGSPEPSPPRVSLQAIAEHTGLSRSTVSLVLNDHPRISPATKAKVRQAARDLGYQPSAALSAAMRLARSGGRFDYRETIGCLTTGKPLDWFDRPDAARYPAHPPASRLLAGLRERAAELGCQLDFLSLENMPVKRLADILQARGIQRLLLLGLWSKRSEIEALQPLWERCRCVALGVADISWLDTVAVLPDYFAAGRTAFFRAWKAGYRHIVYDRSMNDLNPDRRFEAGLRFAAELIPTTTVFESLPLLLRRPHGMERLAEFGSDTCVVGGLESSSYAQLQETRGDAAPGWIDWHANLYQRSCPVSGLDQRESEQARRALDLCLAPWTPPGAPDSGPPEVHLIESAWIPGTTLPQLGNTHLNLLPDKPFPAGAAETLEPLALKSRCPQFLCPDRLWRRETGVPLMPPGEWSFHNVPCLSEGCAESREPGLIAVNSSGLLGSSQRAVISLERRSATLYFLHGAAFARTPGPIGHYRIHYRSGAAINIPIITLGDRPTPAASRPRQKRSRANVQDWWPDMERPIGDHLRAVCLLDCDFRLGQIGYLYLFRWVNPRPETRIEFIEILGEPKVQALFLLKALTTAACPNPPKRAPG